MQSDFPATGLLVSIDGGFVIAVESPELGEMVLTIHVFNPTNKREMPHSNQICSHQSPFSTSTPPSQTPPVSVQ
jgi:hypothetical protein